MQTWNELLDEFRALGGTADNVCLGQGPLGRGLFPVDPSLPVRLKVPNNLLFQVQDLVFEDGALCTAGPETRESAWFEAYAAHLSWGGGGRTEVEAFLQSAAALPENIRLQLVNRFGMGIFAETPSEQLLQQRFVSARAIRSKVGRVLMPIIELANHGGVVEPSIQDEGISLEGQFSGEVLFRYVAHDAVSLFAGWGIASPESKSMSLPLNLQFGSEELVVKRNFVEANLMEVPGLGALWAPKVIVEDRCTTLSYCVLGHKHLPRTPKLVFYRILEEAGFTDAEDKFDIIRHANTGSLLQLLESLESVRGSLARGLRAMARYQLAAMSDCFNPQPSQRSKAGAASAASPQS